jgi:hypothetical protein
MTEAEYQDVTYDPSIYDGNPHRKLGEVEWRVLHYLHGLVDESEAFVKSNHIGSELGISTARAGQAMDVIRRQTQHLHVERWSGKGTTPAVWYVRRGDQ